MYGKQKFKTTQAREWSYQVFNHLNHISNIKNMKAFRESFNSDIEAIEADLTFYFPEDIILLKKGGISGRAFDITNMEKCIVDLIFDKQYFEKDPPYGCENLNLDDKYIISMQSRKRVSPDGEFSMVIKLKTIPLEDVRG